MTPQPPRGRAQASSSEHTSVDGLVELIAERVAERVAATLPERPSTADDGYLDVGAAAVYLACDPQRVYDLVYAGRLRCAKDGRRSVFKREWLDDALEVGE